MKVWEVDIGSGGQGLGYSTIRSNDLHGNTKSNNKIECGHNGISYYILLQCTIVDYGYKWESLIKSFGSIMNTLWGWIELEKENHSRKGIEKTSKIIEENAEIKFKNLLRIHHLTLRD